MQYMHLINKNCIDGEREVHKCSNDTEKKKNYSQEQSG